jgi:DNA topoisomerase-1
MTILIIVESPSKCKKIETYLGSKYKCISTYGHFRTLNKLKDIKITTTELNIHFEIIKEKEKNIKLLEKEIKKADEILIATDDDREGEAIGWHICNYFKLPLTTKRIIFHEVTKQALLKAVDNPLQINMSMVYAQQCRQILDLLVGYKISPCLWTHISRSQNLSAGRCQTPALSIIYENQHLIDNQNFDKVFNIVGLFTSKNVSFTCHHKLITEEDVSDFLKLSLDYQYNFESGKISKIKKVPPVPFITSSIQQYCNTYHNYSPKETMSLCQKLYENGYITYMRTDCPKYSNEFVKDGHVFIQSEYGKEYLREEIKLITLFDNKKSDNKLAQEAHEAIRPTKIDLIDIDNKFSSKEKKMYSIIRNRSLQTLMSNALYESFTVKVKAPKNCYYSQTFQNPIFLGWQIIENKDQETYFHYFKNLEQNNIKLNKVVAKETVSNLKSHLNEAQMIQILEKKGIGRPSTFASIIDKIQTRGYVKKKHVTGKKIKTKEFVLCEKKITFSEKDTEFGNEKNRLIIEPLGKTVIEFLNKYFDSLFKEEFTVQMEKQLDEIKENKMDHIKCVNEYNTFIINLLKDQKKELPSKENKSVNEKYDYVLTKYGPCLSYKNDENKTIFINLKKDTEYETCLENIETIEDYFENNETINLGSYCDKDVIIKNGKYGYYVCYNEKNISIKHLNKKYNEINLADVIDLLDCDKVNVNILREINKDISIRKSKFGNYIFYQTIQMKKPKFIKLKNFKFDCLTCDKKEVEKFVKTNI